MRFLLDENFPFSAVAFLRERGHEVFTLAETCGRGASDEDVFASAQALGAVLLTSDRDFSTRFPIFTRGIAESWSWPSANLHGTPFLLVSAGSCPISLPPTTTGPTSFATIPTDISQPIDCEMKGKHAGS